MKKATLSVIIITLVTKIFGLFRDLVLSYFYGASLFTDAYLISITIPTVIFSFVGLGISTSYIPMYNNIEAEHSKREAVKFTNNLVNALLLICTIIIIFVLIFVEPIVKIFASGFTGEALEYAKNFTRITIFGIYFTSINYVLKSFLQINGNFVVPAIGMIPYDMILIISIAISSFINPLLLPFGLVLAIASQLVLTSIYTRGNGYQYERILSFSTPEMKSMITLMMPVILGTSINQINTIIDRTIASNIILGGISALNYAYKVNDIVLGVFVLSLSTVIYPTMSKYFAEGKIYEMKKALTGGIQYITLILVPATVGISIFSSQIVKLLFYRGAFDSEALFLTSNALLFYSLGMLGFGYRQILSRTYYSLKQTKPLMLNAAVGMSVNIILNIVLSRFMGLSGLALATSISASLTTILLFVGLRKKIGPFGMKQISISFLKILFASSIMGLLAKFSFNYLTASLSQNLSLLLAIGVGAVSYFVIIYFMKIEDVDVIVGAIKKKLGRGAA